MKKTITTILTLFLMIPTFAAEEKPKSDGIVVNGMRLAKKKEDKPQAKQAPKKDTKKSDSTKK